MNKAILIGRLTKDPEHRTTPNGVSVATFTVAVNRRYKDEAGKYQADFINCIAWRSTADFVSKYFQKGYGIGIVGSIQTRSYEDKNGNRRYVTEIVAEEVEFAGSKGTSGDNGGYTPQREEQRCEPQPNPTAAELFRDKFPELELIPDPELPF